MEMMKLDDFYNIYKTVESNDLILDVRTPEEFLEGHIEGAKNINHTDVLESLDSLKNFSKVYIYCRRGARAQYAAAALKEKGLDNLICIYDAGIEAWVNNGHPLIK